MNPKLKIALWCTGGFLGGMATTLGVQKLLEKDEVKKFKAELKAREIAAKAQKPTGT